MKRWGAWVVLAALVAGCGGTVATRPSSPPWQPPYEQSSPSPEASPTPPPSLTPEASGRLIVIVLSAQQLTVYERSAVIASTPVTTGRPGMETPAGDFRILAKYSPYVFISPWPPGDPNHFEPLRTDYAMLFADGGYFIHDAWWQANWGPGANLKTGSHGCVNVPPPVMGAIYDWANVGDEVLVLD